ncbi:hypothetical protein N0K71_06690 [Dellaglioa algida]|uniref:hypothetical protein n=1 Tax=Dellaglioa algida TaxID=105612 RepID=UPI000717294B|nr:hypothetical protein [Dellaglioa algida]MDK1733311.1 hypothetical protein [Dellaglioa algida]MDK1734772.1 hypothetical protein [Dellaglioa algida]
MKKITFKELFDMHHMVLPLSQQVFTRIQNLNPQESIDFILDNDSEELLKNSFNQLLPAEEKTNISQATLKKVAENILILNQWYHSGSHELWIDMINKPIYRCHPSSFIAIPTNSPLKGGATSEFNL